MSKCAGGLDKNKPQFNYRPEIDGLRALAVIAVILHHIHPAILPSGYLGVDIFFVISGYVITGSMVHTKAEGLADHISSFYARRIKRLFPALITCVLVTSFLISLLTPNPSESLQTGLAALIGGSNIVLFARSADYFAPATQLNVFTHTWSLGVEEQFYLFYPFLLWFALKPLAGKRLLKISLVLIAALVAGLMASKWLTGSALGFVPGGILTLLPLIPYLLVACAIPVAAYLKPWKSGRKNALTILGLLAVVSLAFYWHAYDTRFSMAYFLMPARLWELAAGCILFLYSDGRDHFKTPGALTMAVFVLLIAALFLPIDFGKQATLIVVGLTTLLLGFIHPRYGVYRILTHPWALKLGLISYSLYLWHWSVLSISRWTIGVSPQTIGIQLILMLLLSLASYHFIEQPFRRSKRLRSRLQVLGTGCTALVLAILGVFALKAQASHLSLDRRFPSEFGNQLAKGAADFNTNRIDRRVNRQELMMSLTSNKGGVPLPRPRVYLFGDSHADHYRDALAESLPERGLGSATIGWRCGYISPADIGPLTREWIDGCEDYKSFLDAFIENELQPGDVVILSQRWNEKKDNQHQAAVLSQLSQNLAAKDVHLVLLDDVPELGNVEDPLLCERRPWRPLPMTQCYQSLAHVNRTQKPLDAMAAALIRNHKNVHYLRLRELYCDGTICGPTVGKTMIYRDNNHLNHAGSLIGARRIADLVRRLSPLPPPQLGAEPQAWAAPGQSGPGPTAENPPGL